MTTTAKPEPKSRTVFELCRDATLIRISASTFTGNVNDKELAEDLANSTRADVDRMGVLLRRIRKEDRLPAQQIVSEARRYLDSVGGQWDKDGHRLVPNVKRDEVMAKLDEFARRFHDAVRDFLGRYDEIYANARKEMTPAIFDRVGFPSKGEIKEKYKFEIRQGVFPDPSDLRLSGVSPAARKEIEASVRAEQQDKMKEIHAQCVDRLTAALQRAVTQLPKFEKEEITRFEDSLVGSLLELCDVLPSLNITGDRTLETAIAKTRALFSKADLKLLRARGTADKEGEGKKARKEIVTAGKDLLSLLKGGAVKKKI